MRKVLDDAALGISLLADHTNVKVNSIGVLGHSYGGNTVLFQAAADQRIAFACSSGAACSYKYKLAHDIPLEFALVIPGILNEFDLPRLIQNIAPRSLLLVSATEDRYSKDADAIYDEAHDVYSALGQADQLEHYRYPGGHDITETRVNDVLNWFRKFL